MKTLYEHSEVYHNFIAASEVVSLVLEMVHPKSVVDIGCGTGTWLKVFADEGLTDFVGVDGPYVDKNSLKFPAEKFVAQDLRKSWSLNRKFDLALCLEVAEHLPEDCAEIIVDAITSHADVILFSAAIPGQGGQNHINEQWPQYWEQKFNKRGFYFHDDVRPLIWNNEKVDWWYRQNIFLIRKGIKPAGAIRAVVHPNLFALTLSYESRIRNGQLGVRDSLKILANSMKLLFQNWFSR